MPMYRALALCPNAVVIQPRHRLYSDYSRRVMEILRQTSALVEPSSIDEACVDVTEQIEVWEQAVDVARQLQIRVRHEVGLSASLGAAANKLVAKVASDRDKPGGLTVVRPGEEADFLAPLPVRVLCGVGPVTAEKLAGMGVTTVGELALLPEADLRMRFGQHGLALAQQARGIDRRPLANRSEIKSVSSERTFSRDVTGAETLKLQLWRLSQGVARRLRKKGLAARTVAIKLRYADFTTLTRQMRLMVPTDDERSIYQTSLVLLDQTRQRGRRVRLLGVAGRQLSPPTGQLLML
jgi:DNA polymerase-4